MGAIGPVPAGAPRVWPTVPPEPPRGKAPSSGSYRPALAGGLASTLTLRIATPNSIGQSPPRCIHGALAHLPLACGCAPDCASPALGCVASLLFLSSYCPPPEKFIVIITVTIILVPSSCPPNQLRTSRTGHGDSFPAAGHLFGLALTNKADATTVHQPLCFLS